MPPLPSTTQTLAERLNYLSESHKAALQLIQRLSKLDFQPGATKSEDGDARLELSAEIHASLNQLDEELELLRQEVQDVVQGGLATARRRDSVRESEKSRLAVLLARLTEDLKFSRVQFRKAQLTAKRNADRAKLKERELLFSGLQSGSSTPSTRHRKHANNTSTEKEVITSAASDVTSALRRTQQLMQSELSRSRFAQETLEQSTAALADLGEKYTDLSSLLNKSRSLVTTLLKSQKSDTWYLETTLYILLTTVIWLIFRRWLYGPITWGIVWPLKLLFKIAFAIVPTASLASSSSVATSQEPRTSLIIKPSATDKPPKRPVNANQPPPYVRVGGGGKGYIQHHQDPSPPGSLSQTVGQMAEQNQNQQGGQQKETVVRGDGTVLPDRGSDKPANPKKKMWEEDVESAKHEREEAERTQGGNTEGQKAEAGDGGPRLRKRDEL